MKSPFLILQHLYRLTAPIGLRRQLSCARNIVALKRSGGSREIVQFEVARFWQGMGRNVLKSKLKSRMRLWVDVRDKGVGLQLFIRGEFEPDEIAFIQSYLQPGMTVIDVGANIGHHAVIAATAVGPSGRVIAIEPDPHNADILRRNTRLHRLKNTSIVQCAVGEHQGKLTLYRSPENYGDHRLYESEAGRDGVEVEVRVLDDVLDQHHVQKVDLLKIDVQGYEAVVFAGLERTLNSNPPAVIMMEYWPDGIRKAGSDPSQLMDSLLALGYKFHSLKPDGKTDPVDRHAIDQLLPSATGRPDDVFVNLILIRTTV